ncbi:hypothetical protein GCM10023096_59190 [Nonomuraea ferruginea]
MPRLPRPSPGRRPRRGFPRNGTRTGRGFRFHGTRTGRGFRFHGTRTGRGFRFYGTRFGAVGPVGFGHDGRLRSERFLTLAGLLRPAAVIAGGPLRTLVRGVIRGAFGPPGAVRFGVVVRVARCGHVPLSRRGLHAGYFTFSQERHLKPDDTGNPPVIFRPNGRGPARTHPGCASTKPADLD